ncbi:hypothetical protein FOXG_01395 [Fusarium oxysporum f. sp. lycopersici 4287]|uniref:Transcription factor domain-containing protein n=2 Tax=Fusarium oxysporum TaxID=5507 RepID=A0A0J9UAJ9_FUSO4|nr:hypothetical protein FOXG_01395 [Fusarium oxysporum f. sp. lycopersici 4287]KNA96044.1 hypothetical protein FOXG_01395 [Fusarium oxysporum f. sp. lycopersici 4287]
MMKYFRKQDFPILSLDQDLVYIYWQRYRNSSFTEEMNDEGLLQLPYATSLYITRSMCKPLFILELEGNGLDDIRCLRKWMADTYKAILCRKPSTYLIRALLLAVLCFQREGEFAQASKAFEQATSIFRTVSSGWDELSIEDQQELTLIFWELSKFLELDKLGFDPPLLDTCDLRTATQAFLSGL